MRRKLCLLALTWVLTLGVGAGPLAVGAAAGQSPAEEAGRLRSAVALQSGVASEEDALWSEAARLSSAAALADAPSTADCTERRFYDEDGNLLELEALAQQIDSHEAAVTRGAVCCTNMQKKTVYDEQHSYTPPAPAWCTYDRYVLVMCTSCGRIHSYEYEGQDTHVHQ